MYETEYLIQERVTLTSFDRNKCAFIADILVVQCIVVTIGSISILYCMWSPDKATMDFDKLARIMYLFDSEACGYKVNVAKLVTNLHISNETFGLDVRPIKWLPAIVTVSTRLSARTQKYIETSLAVHIIWALLAITFRIFTKKSEDVRTLKVVLAIFLYACIFIIFFDLSMAVVYVSHIKQSLTKGMILRYSGWSTEIKLQSYDDFAGWLPMAAAFCWMRGFVIFFMNIYFCRIINILRKRIRRREVKKKYPNDRYLPIPEPVQVQATDKNVLIYRIGEDRPHTPKISIF